MSLAPKKLSIESNFAIALHGFALLRFVIKNLASLSQRNQQFSNNFSFYFFSFCIPQKKGRQALRKPK